MPYNTNPAWHGGARQKVSFWSNGSADNRDLIFQYTSLLSAAAGGQSGHVMYRQRFGAAEGSSRQSL